MISSTVLTACLVAFCSLAIATPFLGKSPILGKSLKQWDQQNLFQADIEMPEGRNALLQTSPRRWPNGVVYYDWIGQNWTQDYMDMLNDAFRMIEKHTCIKFVKHTNEPNFINIVDGGSCSSELVGMSGVRQRLSLMTLDEKGGTCWGIGTVMHELLHAVGLWHEQMRYDRDDYLDVHPENYGGAEFQFKKVFANVSSTYDVPYNYRSIMQYTAWSFSTNGKPTMTPKPGSGITPEELGRGEIWEYESDWEKVRRMYNCKGTYPLEACDDNYSSCDSYKNQCNSADWMKQYCPKTCGFCPQGIPTPKPAAGTCKDEVDYCHQYANECGKLDWLKNYCRKTCSFCSDNCKDDLSYCATYVDQCGKVDWTKTSCRKTCGFC